MKTSDRLVRSLERQHNGEPWHGPSRAAILADVTWAEAAWQPPGGGNSIWALVLHMRAWTREVLARAKGGVPGTPAEGDFPAVPKPSAAAWKETLASLEAAHAELAGAVRTMDEDALAAKVKSRPGEPAGSGISVRSMIGSLAEHDIYHSGQVAVLKRLARAAR
jgi:uncharacterized damage-inducible protein DinB